MLLTKGTAPYTEGRKSVPAWDWSEKSATAEINYNGTSQIVASRFGLM